MCTNLGIFLGIGVDHLWYSSKANIRIFIRIIRISLTHAWSAEGSIEGETPLLPIRGRDSAQPPAMPHDNGDEPVGEWRSQRMIFPEEQGQRDG